MLTPSPSVVREGTPGDYLQVWKLFLQGHNENGLFALAPHKIEWLLTRLLCPEAIHPADTGLRGAIGVIGPPNALEALCVLTIAEYWYTDEKHLEEFLVYVDPEYRQSDHAKALVAWMKHQTDITGIPLLTGIISKERTQAKCRLYGRMLPKIGEFFLYTGKGGQVTGASSAAFA